MSEISGIISEFSRSMSDTFSQSPQMIKQHSLTSDGESRRVLN
ncbi:hypothetical protein HMPREF9999_01500 [Alloprevotella sp. oral taxon 473 str. F0040]|nr:hypothetical protein HMPREF9999_01500 [Alloprevotella sp. oral taxon 473 str. F0040]